MSSESQQDLLFEISTDLYTKLWKSKVFSHTVPDLPPDQKTVKLNQEQTHYLQNGVALGNYLLVLRNALRRNNQDLNVDETVIEGLVNTQTNDVKINNFKKIATELDKVGISIEEEDIEAMAKGEKDKIISPFMRIERFLTKIAGKQIFDFEDLEEQNFQNKNAAPSQANNSSPRTNQFQKQPIALSKPVERQKSILKNQTSIKPQLLSLQNTNIPSQVGSPQPSPIRVSSTITPANKNYTNVVLPDKKVGGTISEPLSKKVTQQKTGGKQSEKATTNQTLINKRGSRPNQKKTGSPAVVDILSMNVNRLPAETETSLELILNTLCRSCEIKPKQAAALLTNNNQFLIQAVVKGIKGQYQLIQQWFQELYVNSSHLCMLVEQETEDFPESGNCQKVLQSVACGMYSVKDNLEISLQCLKVLNRICDEFTVNQSVIEQAFKWFTAKEGGFELCLHALSNHSIQDIGEDIAGLISIFVTTAVNPEERFIQIYQDRFLKYYASPALYIQAINEMLPYIIMKNNEELLRSDILRQWIDIAVRQADNQSKLTIEERIPSITFLTEVWFHFTPYIDQQGPDVANSFLAALRKCSRDKSTAARIVAISQMFRLLDKFAVEKNASAPLIYKSLIFTMVESCNDQTLREHYLFNFTFLFQNVPSIPIGLLIEPLLKQMQQTQQAKPFDFTAVDYEFFKNLSRHQKFNLNMALAVADLLSKLFLSDPIASISLMSTLVDIFARYLYSESPSMDQPMHDFTFKFVTVAISSLVEIEKQGKNGSGTSLPPKGSSPSKRTIIGGGKAQKKVENGRSEVIIRKAQIIGIVQRILQMRIDELNEEIKIILIRNFKECQSKFGINHKGIMSLMAFFSNNPLDLLPSKESQKQNLPKPTLLTKMKQDPGAKKSMAISPSGSSLLAILPADQSLSQTNSQTALEVYKEKPPSTLNAIKGNAKPRSISTYHSSVPSRKPALQSQEGGLVPLALPSPNDLNYASSQRPVGSDLHFYQNRNQLEMDKLRRKRHEEELIKKADEEKKRAASARRKERLQNMLEKRKAELGVSSVRKPLIENLGINSSNLRPSGESQKALIHEDGSVVQEFEKAKWEKSYKIQMVLLDLSLEEQRDQEAIKVVMKKYQRLWRNLFSKYANTIQTNHIVDFDEISEKTQQINYPEVTKMLKDHGLLPVFISKEEVYQLFRLVNLKNNLKSETKTLDYNGYHQLIPQLAFLSFSRPPKDLSYMPLVESLLTLIQIFRETARTKGWALFLYEDPELGSQPGIDQQLIKALNEKVRKDPTYPIPEGFMKVTEKTPVYNYHIPKEIAGRLKESQVIGIEFLDEFLYNALAIHFLEPLVTFEDMPKVKPVIISQIKTPAPQAEAVTLMNKAERKQKLQAIGADPTSRSLSQLKQTTAEDDFFKPKLSLTLKLEVSKHPLTERPHIQEVAEVLEEVLCFLHDKDGSLPLADSPVHLPPRPRRIPGKTDNEARRQRDQQERQHSEMRAKDLDKWKKRKHQLLTDLEKMKESKEKEARDKEAQDKLDREKEEKRKKKLEEDVKKRYDDNKKKIEEAKKQKAIEEEEKKKKEEWDNKDQKEKRVKEAKEFFQKQKDRLIQEFDQVAKDREAVQEKKNEIKKKEEEQQQKLKVAMEGYIKNNGKSIKEVIIKENQQIVDFLNRDDIKELFDRYERSLRHLYRFYSAQDKLDWLDHNKENMNMKEFIRFSFQHRIVPVLLEKPDDLVKLFKHTIKAEGPTAQNHFTYAAFCKALVRIAVVGQDQIGGQHGDNDLLSQRMQLIIKEQEQERLKKDKLKKREEDKAREEEEKKKELEKEFKEKVAIKVIKKVEVNQGKKIYQEMPEEKIYEINENLKKQEEEFFNKWLKIRENKGVKAKKAAGTTLDSNESPNIRKTKEQRQLKELASAEQKVDGLNHIETILDDAKKVKALDSVKSTDFDIKIITAATMDNLLQFIGLTSSAGEQELNKHLERKRIDVQGQKPNRILKDSTKNDLRLVSRQGENGPGSRQISVKRASRIGNESTIQNKDIKEVVATEKDKNTLELKKPESIPQSQPKNSPKAQTIDPSKSKQPETIPKPIDPTKSLETIPSKNPKEESKKSPGDPNPSSSTNDEPKVQEVWNNGKPNLEQANKQPDNPQKPLQQQAPDSSQDNDKIKPGPVDLDKQSPLTIGNNNELKRGETVKTEAGEAEIKPVQTKKQQEENDPKKENKKAEPEKTQDKSPVNKNKIN